MNQKTFNEAIIAIIIIGFIIVIAQNRMILNAVTPQETPLTKLMALPEMQQFKDYQASITYLTLEQVQQLAEEQPEIYSNINKAIYIAELTGEKTITILYDYENNAILNMFEMINAELG